MKKRFIIAVIKYYLPFLSKIKKSNIFVKNKYNEIKHKANAKYSYSVWLRHLVIIESLGLDINWDIIAELGPGDSLGVGIMGILTGSDKYYALDVTKHLSVEDNISMVDELVNLLLNQTDIPDDKELPRVHPKLNSYEFPRGILKNRIINNVNEIKIKRIKESLKSAKPMNGKIPSIIEYFCPWDDNNIIKKKSVDLIFSQAVLEHVEKLEHTYKSMYDWLKDGGIISHQIDFKSHGSSEKWNGHWSYSDFIWKIITHYNLGGINREPLSVHLKLMKKVGFNIISVIPFEDYNMDDLSPFHYQKSIDCHKLSNRFKSITEDDFHTCNAHIVAEKL